MTKTPLAFHAGMFSDAGLLRSNNEDRAHIDEAAGIFLVVDGMGGHAAGEKAAETAVEVIAQQLRTATGAVDASIRNAITAANNEIYRLSQIHEDWSGMACVLTCAVAHGDKVTVGHVGDSRMYLAWTGGLRKLTSDHSPVGEREDRGDLTESEAMRDPRRNQVFRDVGSRPRQPFEEEFIETKTFPFRSDAAFLLCTDGLSDVVTSAEMNRIVQHYAGDPQQTAQELVEAANEAGGKDNITVIFIAGPDFVGAESKAIGEARTRHSITRLKHHAGPVTAVLSRLLWLTAGAALGIAGMLASEKFIPRLNAPAPLESRAPRHILANPADPKSIVRALAAAHAGDVIEVPKGEYLGPLELREDVDVISVSPGDTVLHADPHAAFDPGIAIAAHNLKAARVTGFRIEGTDANPLTAGIWMDSSSVEANELTISGANHCAVHFTGNSAGVLRASDIQDASGCSILIEGESTPRIIGNQISGANIEARPPARPVLRNNTVQPPEKRK